MGQLAPTARFYTERQSELSRMLTRLVQVAYDRKVALGLARKPAGDDYGIVVAVTETARADNAALAEAARDIVQALSQMRAQGWIDDATAIQLAFKFAGEPIPQEEIERILEIHGEQSEATRPWTVAKSHPR